MGSAVMLSLSDLLGNEWEWGSGIHADTARYGDYRTLRGGGGLIAPGAFGRRFAGGALRMP